ncbi:hypothetical protein SALBM217S_07662 [Streptomyces griseoloalbus]
MPEPDSESGAILRPPCAAPVRIRRRSPVVVGAVRGPAVAVTTDARSRRAVRRAPGGLPRALRLARLLRARVPRVLGVAHDDASMASRSAAMPREPYALTEPSEMPSVSATWASVMSAK